MVNFSDSEDHLFFLPNEDKTTPEANDGNTFLTLKAPVFPPYLSNEY